MRAELPIQTPGRVRPEGAEKWGSLGAVGAEWGPDGGFAVARIPEMKRNSLHDLSFLIFTALTRGLLRPLVI